MDFQFIIPHTNSELLNTNGNNYFVKKVYDAADLSELFKGSLNLDACYEICIEFAVPDLTYTILAYIYFSDSLIHIFGSCRGPKCRRGSFSHLRSL